MRKIVFGTMLMMLLAGHVKSQDFENFPITKVRISKNILLYKTGLTDSYPNMLAVKTSAGIVVFDALQYPQVALRVREMIGKPDKMRSTYPGNPLEIDESIESIRAMINEIKIDSFHLILPDTLFRDKFTLRTGKTTFIMENNTPSYSTSDIVIYIPEEKTLMLGDIFNKNRLPWFKPTTDFERWEELFEPYIKEDTEVKYFLGSHGYPIDVVEIREQFKYLRKLYTEVKRYKTEGKKVEDAKKDLALEKFPYLSSYNPYFYGTTMHVHNLNIDAIWRQTK